MKGLPDFNPADRRFWPDKPDIGFSPERNKKIIEGTIKKYEANRVKKLKFFKKALGERVDAAASYLTGRYGAHRSKPIEKYFTKRYLAELRGKEIVDELRRVDTGQPSNLRQKVWEEKGVYIGGPKKQEC